MGHAFSQVNVTITIHHYIPLRSTPPPMLRIPSRNVAVAVPRTKTHVRKEGRGRGEYGRAGISSLFLSYPVGVVGSSGGAVQAPSRLTGPTGPCFLLHVWIHGGVYLRVTLLRGQRCLCGFCSRCAGRCAGHWRRLLLVSCEACTVDVYPTTSNISGMYFGREAPPPPATWPC